MSEFAAPRAGRLLMGLYPAAYRAAHGADIEAVFAETAEGLTRRQVLRERRDLAKHALRLRLRIGPTDPAGRVLAGAAPVVVAVAAGYALHLLLPTLPELVERFRNPHPVYGLRPALVQGIASAVPTLPWLLALVFSVLGRWRAARIFGVLGALAGASTPLLVGSHQMFMLGEAVGAALGGLVLALAPSTLVDGSPRGRWEVAGLALGVAFPLMAADRFGVLSPGGAVYVQYLELLPAWLCTATAVVLLLRLSARPPDLHRSAGVALGIVPQLLFIPFLFLDGAMNPRLALRLAAVSLAPFAVALVLALAIHLARRARRTAGPV
ncbi:hypothetical protein ACIA8O_11570 [Kitasatospora sp. NPDC051853]|uniref:hypothetical protein n=1 Tax=Kitasatospora sp. NPDC051853 TaxID=3364058 RepID=UPI0037B36F16